MVTEFLEDLIEAISVGDLDEVYNAVDEIEYYLRDGKETFNTTGQECFDLVQDAKRVFATDEDVAFVMAEMALDVYTLPTVEGFVFNKAEEKAKFEAIKEYARSYREDFTPVEQTQFEMKNKRVVRDFLDFLEAEHQRRFYETA